jgi:hypothetical protein
MRVQLMDAGEQLHTRHARQPLPRQRERDLDALLGELLERAERGLGRGLAHDRVVPRVAIVQLPRHRPERLAIVVYG